MAKFAVAKIQGISPLIQSKAHQEPKLNKELADAYEQRTWRSKMHVSNEDGGVILPGIAFKRALEEAAKYLSIQIPGKGKATYTKHFEAGVLISSDVALYTAKGERIMPDGVKGETIFVNADGVRGSGKRVYKVFPMIPSGWIGEIDIEIFDDVLTDDVVKHHLEQAGNLIGVGSFRVRNGGFCGRFRVVDFEMGDYAKKIA